MYAKILIPAIIGVLAAIGACQPVPPNSNIVQGVFIPSDTIKTLEDKARQNGQNVDNQGPVLQMNSAPAAQDTTLNLENNNRLAQQNTQMQSIPQNLQQIPQNFQLQPVNNQQALYANQPQQIYPNNPQQQTNAPPQLMLVNSQPQPGQQAILVSQPILQNSQPVNQQPNQQYIIAHPIGPNQPQILVGQPNQQQAILMNPQTNQPVLLASNQLPNNVMIQNPNGMGQAAVIGTSANGETMGTPLQNQGIYAVIPLNNQNLPNNMNNGNTYLVPVQQVPTNSVLMNAGK